MLSIRKILFVSAFILSIPAMAKVALNATTDATMAHILPLFEKNIQDMIYKQGLPGVAVVIVSRDKIYYLKGFGVQRIGKEAKISPSTLFQIASLSKPVNATLLAILQEKGKLYLTDPVNRYIPYFQKSAHGQALKIQHVMSHSSGISNNGFNEQIEAFASRHAILDRLQKRRPVAAPGTQFVYHNAMYGVIEDIVGRATGKPLKQTLREELFTPLGMHRACVGMDAMLYAKNRAYPHVPNRRGKYVPAEHYSKAYYSVMAAGGVNASVEDFIPFLQLYLGKPSHVVSKSSLDNLTRPYIQNTNAVIKHAAKKGVIANTSYGLGWQSMTYANKKVVYHQGHLKGFRNFIGLLDDDVGIVILTNAERKHSTKLALKFMELYFNHG